MWCSLCHVMYLCKHCIFITWPSLKTCTCITNIVAYYGCTCTGVKQDRTMVWRHDGMNVCYFMKLNNRIDLRQPTFLAFFRASRPWFFIPALPKIMSRVQASIVCVFEPLQSFMQSFRFSYNSWVLYYSNYWLRQSPMKQWYLHDVFLNYLTCEALNSVIFIDHGIESLNC
jgi:hypothetical protein